MPVRQQANNEQTQITGHVGRSDPQVAQHVHPVVDGVPGPNDGRRQGQTGGKDQNGAIPGWGRRAKSRFRHARAEAAPKGIEQAIEQQVLDKPEMEHVDRPRYTPIRPSPAAQ